MQAQRLGLDGRLGVGQKEKKEHVAL